MLLPIHPHSHLYSHYRWAPTFPWEGQCRIFSSIAISSHFHLFRKQAYSFLLAFILDATAMTDLLEHLWPLLPVTISHQTPPLKGFDFKKRPFAIGNRWFLCLCSPTWVLGRGSVGRTAVPYPGVQEKGLACIRLRLIVKKRGRERGDRDTRNSVISTTAASQEKGAKEIYICLPTNLNLDTGRSQRTVIYELSKTEKFLLTLYFQLLHAFLQDDSVIL